MPNPMKEAIPKIQKLLEVRRALHTSCYHCACLGVACSAGERSDELSWTAMQILGIPVIRVAGVEADDVIGTVASRGIDDGFLVAIASPDKVSIFACC